MNLKRARQHKIHQQIQKVPEDKSTMYYFAGSLILHGSMELAMLVKGIPRNQYVEIRQEKPEKKEQRDWPEYKTCKSTTEAIITEGTEKGELRKICADPNCPVHHPKKQQTQSAAA
jgi:hypothetical protein